MFAVHSEGNPTTVAAEPRSGVRVLLVTRRTSGAGRRMESLLAQLQLRARDRIDVQTLDADQSPDLVQRLGVSKIPSIVVVKNGRPVEVLGGRATFAEIERVVAPYADDQPR
jgi:thioredoxin-like negative regulator of GroEL